MRINSSYSLYNTGNQINSYNFYSSIVDYSNLASRSRSANSLLNQNKSSIYDSFINTDYIDRIKSNLSDLESKTESLLVEKEDSAFNQRVASSSDSDIVTANAEIGAAKEEYEVEVNQLATTDLNESASFISGDVNSFTTGENTLEVSQSGETVELSVDVADTDTNSDVLYKLEEEINNSELNLKADVINNDDGTVYLEVEATETGTGDKFSITDKNSDLVAQANLDNKVRSAQDADFDVNGENYVNTSNQVEIAEGEVGLNLESVGEATITVAQDEQSLIEAAESFVNQFNDTLDFLRENINQGKSFELAEDLIEITEGQESDLEEVGIDIRIDGKLSLDKENFSQSLEDNYAEVENTLGSVTGVAAEVDDKIENTLSGPISQYSDLGQYDFYNQTGQSIFPFQSLYTGVLFDSYF